jgi:hypothetical protein
LTGHGIVKWVQTCNIHVSNPSRSLPLLLPSGDKVV